MLTKFKYVACLTFGISLTQIVAYGYTGNIQFMSFWLALALFSLFIRTLQ